MEEQYQELDEREKKARAAAARLEADLVRRFMEMKEVMTDDYERSKERRRKLADSFTKKVALREKLRIRAGKHKDETVWFGLGMFGLIGWSVAIPTLIGVVIGIWIDSTYPSRFSWTLMMLIMGVAVGCMNAWYWVRKTGIRELENSD